MKKSRQVGTSTIPKRVQVGATTYDIVITDIDATGRTNEYTQQIQLNAGQGPDTCADTLIHEILHAICFQALRNVMSQDDEEQVVAALAPRLLGIIRDNPDLMEFIG